MVFSTTTCKLHLDVQTTGCNYALVVVVIETKAVLLSALHCLNAEEQKKKIRKKIIDMALLFSRYLDVMMELFPFPPCSAIGPLKR